jgi:GH25 family lysozyme M1 (1,4-beta-N-acetylmuramidase)
VAFIRDLVNQGEALGIKMGIYSSESQWGPITGNDESFSNYPLWWAYYDGNPSWAGWSPFAGWSQPAIKQFQGTTSICGASIDENWYP